MVIYARGGSSLFRLAYPEPPRHFAPCVEYAPTLATAPPEGGNSPGVTHRIAVPPHEKNGFRPSPPLIVVGGKGSASLTHN